MKEIKIHYSQRDNIGDAINPMIIQEVFGMIPVHASIYECDTSGIGSGMGRYCFDPKSQNLLGLFKKRIAKLYYTKHLTVWSTGFIREPIGELEFRRKNVSVSCVRGKLTKGYMEKIFSKHLDCKTGDGGILACELIKRSAEKEYSIGIIPHDSERFEPKFQELQSRIPNSVIIDVRGDVKERLDTISKCETIISSSLHGLIIADSFNIPNRQMVFTERLDGDGYKFKDYCSNFDQEPNPININEINFLSQYDITDNYTITTAQIDKMKKDVYDSFIKYTK